MIAHRRYSTVFRVRGPQAKAELNSAFYPLGCELGFEGKYPGRVRLSLRRWRSKSHGAPYAPSDNPRMP